MAEPTTGAPWVGFDFRALYLDVDRKRGELEISMAEVARRCGHNTPTTLTRLRQGHAVSVDSLARLMVWLGTTDMSRYLIIDAPRSAPGARKPVS